MKTSWSCLILAPLSASPPDISFNIDVLRLPATLSVTVTSRLPFKLAKVRFMASSPNLETVISLGRSGQANLPSPKIAVSVRMRTAFAVSATAPKEEQRLIRDGG